METNNILAILETINVNDFDFNKEQKVIKEAIAFVKNNGLDNVAIAYEELAELQQVITKEIRGKGNRLDAIEEICDVILGIDFLNEVYDINVNTLIERCVVDEYTSLFYVLRGLTTLQDKILDAILNNDITCLKDCSENVLFMLETLKHHFNITNDEITKLKIYKINRLQERMDNKTLI